MPHGYCQALCIVQNRKGGTERVRSCPLTPVPGIEMAWFALATPEYHANGSTENGQAS